MANRDGSGPAGKGPKTGRGLGPCKPSSTGTRPKNGTGRKLGRGRR